MADQNGPKELAKRLRQPAREDVRAANILAKQLTSALTSVQDRRRASGLREDARAELERCVRLATALGAHVAAALSIVKAPPEGGAE